MQGRNPSSLENFSEGALDRLERLFRAARMHPPGERAAFLEAACADDPALRREVESLLAADDAAEDEAFLGEPAPWDLVSETDAAGKDDEVPEETRRVGPYTILRSLGRGGMGHVYLALRDAPFKRYVALKIIRRGMDTREVLQRFEMERQILAALDHPSIARLLDGGMTDDGRPYFAMEYVEGLPLTTYCDQHRLGVDDRLRLFRTVCHAVHYAHQNLVIHRDLKPPNILVTKEGVVKLLDFGIAKLLNPHLSHVEMPVTRTELRLMTPEYASPEQVRGEALTTSSDVYALGVLLYELLTGHRPYRLTRRTPQEILQVVCEQDPERPSTVVTRAEPAPHDTASPVTPEAVGAARGASPERLRRHLRGDLDNIVLMALRKEPSRRYASAEQFSQDLGRYLRGLPVVAHRDSRGYRLRKFVRRYRAETIAAAVVALLIVGFAAATLRQADRIAHERDRARYEAQKAEQVTGFLLSLFETADPARAPGDSLRVRDVLEMGANRVEAELAGQPAVQASMLDVVGHAYQNLGHFERARQFFEQSLALRRQVYGPRHEEVAESLFDLGGLLELHQDLDGAERTYRAFADLQRGLHGEGHPTYLLGLYRLWGVLHLRGEAAAADSLFDVVLRIQRDLQDGGDDPVRALTMAEIAYALSALRRYDEAENLLRQSLAMERRLFGNQHPRVADRLYRLSHLLNALERFEEAEPLAREVVALRERFHPEGHTEVVVALERLSDALYGLGRTGEAETVLRQSLARIRTLPEASSLMPALYARPLAELLAEQQRYDEAEALRREIVERYERFYGLDDLATVEAREHLADVLVATGGFAEAERLLLASFHTLRGRYGERNLYTRAALRRLATLYDAWERPDDAEHYRALLDQSGGLRSH